MAGVPTSNLNQSGVQILPAYARPLNALPPAPFKFSICTLVTRPGEYAEMLESFVQAGFSPEDCEYLHISNADGNHHDAYNGYNLFLQAARGEHIILCHQDVLLVHDRREVLEKRIQELGALDPGWALLGNAGIVVRFGLPVVAIRISHPSGNCTFGTFPTRVDSLDENFIVVRREANLCVSHDLTGFHFYGTDLCRIARVLGRTAYAVDFHLLHKSEGTLDGQFFRDRARFVKKYQKALRGGAVYATTGQIYLSGNALSTWLFNLGRREILFAHLHEQRRHLGKTPTPAALENIKKLRQELGLPSLAVLWLRHKINRPFNKAQRWLGKKIFNRRASATRANR